MVNPFAPIVEKLSVNFWFMALMAVIIPTSAIMPNAIIATVNPVLSLLLRTVRYAKEKMSPVFIAYRKLRTSIEKEASRLPNKSAKDVLEIEPVND